jgi:hypothetical protein
MDKLTINLSIEEINVVLHTLGQLADIQWRVSFADKHKSAS